LEGRIEGLVDQGVGWRLHAANLARPPVSATVSKGAAITTAKSCFVGCWMTNDRNAEEERVSVQVSAFLNELTPLSFPFLNELTPMSFFLTPMSFPIRITMETGTSLRTQNQAEGKSAC
jgi:hypothetical protein